MRKVFLLAFLVCALPLLAQAQFNSGSTGADGALDLSTMTCPNNICDVQLPESGVLNYTTINIPGVPTHRTLRFIRNSRNTPVIILAQGNVLISGSIVVNASATLPTLPFPDTFRQPGPGGFYGGAPNKPGFGAGGGQVSSNNVSPGRWVGPLSLFPIVGGSGGGGISGAYGGGGGGAIVIASSTSIVISSPNAGIDSSGSQSSSGNFGPGSGGAIRLVANSLDIRGNLQAVGGSGGSNGAGVIRLEAQPNQINFAGTSNPAAILSTINPNVVSNAQPQLTILSVGGYAIPSYAGSRIDTVDLLLPNQIPDPVNVIVRGNNIPVGTQVSVGFVNGSPNGTTTPCNLAGTGANSQCTATISNLTRTGVTYLLATATFAPPAPLAKNNPKGKDQIAQIRLESVLGKQPKYVFLRSDKSAIDAAKVPKEFLEYFGM